MKNRWLVILRFAVVALFLSYYGGATLFTHTHSFEWGEVTHSHPYMPSGAHSHTAAGVQLIHSLSSVLFIVSAVALLPVDYAQNYERVAKVVPRTLLVYSTRRQSRAPPVW